MCCSIVFVWMIILQDFIHSLKIYNHLALYSIITRYCIFCYIIPIMDYTGRFHRKDVPFSGWRYKKGKGFHELKYRSKRAGKTVISGI